MNKIIKDFLNEKKGKKEIKECLFSLSNQAANLNFVACSAKFTHPSSNKNCSVKSKSLGDSDAIGHSGSLVSAKFLQLKINDKAIINYFKDDEDIRNELDLDKIEYDILRNNFLKILNYKQATDAYAKQIYFPINNNDKYHTLTILTNHNELNIFNEKIKSILFTNKTNKKSNNEDYDVLPKVTRIRYGGTKSLNIGLYNSRNSGYYYMLKTLPPTISNSFIKLPRRNFFDECLKYYEFRHIFKSFDKILKNKTNNKSIRNHRDSVIYYMTEKIISKVNSIRKSNYGFTNQKNYVNLRKEDKVLLDDQYKDQRDKEWRDNIIDNIVKFIINTYNKNFDDILGDHELNYIKNYIIKHEDILV